MSNSTHQHKQKTDFLFLATKKIPFLFAMLFVIGLNNSHAQNTWTRKADFGGVARNKAVGFSIGNKGYIGTGYDFSYIKDFWEYDPATNAWTQKADFGGYGRPGAVGFSIGSKGYIGTGSFNTDFWEYDPATNVWKQKADFGGGNRDLAVGFSIGSKGYIGTGWDFNGKLMKDFWEYDPASDTWTQKADLRGTARMDAVGFSIGSKGYIGTGNTNAFNGSPTRDFWEYNPATNTWTQKADFGGGNRYGAVGFSIGSKGYIGTGAIKDFWEYDTVANQWIPKAGFGGNATYGAVGFSIDSKGYIGTGGSDNGLEKDFWEYTPDNGCPTPGGLQVLHVSDTCAVLTWDAAGADIVKLKFRYRVAGDATWTQQRKSPDRNRMYINELTPNTKYQWQLRSFCAEDTSGWIKGPDFITAASLNPLANAKVYPNPVQNIVTVNYTASRTGKYIFEITGISGNVLLHKEANALQGANHITLDISRFFKGVYFLNIIMPDKTRERTQLSKE